MNDLIKNPDNLPGCFLFSWASDWGQDRYGLWVAFTYKNVRQCFRWIKPGTFMMGSPENEMERDDDEVLHEVKISQGFWIADTACTQALWQTVMGGNPSRFKGDQRPVEKVSWNDCLEFIEKINRLKPGLDMRFPTEAEWEYACRAGTQTPFWFGDNITPEQVNYDGNYPYAGGEKGKFRGETVEVMSLPCNGWGLYQMHGNVWEWCVDWFADYLAERVIDPVGPPDGEYRVIRGGSWISFGRFVRSAYRRRSEPDYRNDYTGFRLARGQKEAGK